MSAPIHDSWPSNVQAYGTPCPGVCKEPQTLATPLQTKVFMTSPQGLCTPLPLCRGGFLCRFLGFVLQVDVVVWLPLVAWPHRFAGICTAVALSRSPRHLFAGPSQAQRRPQGNCRCLEYGQTRGGCLPYAQKQLLVETGSSSIYTTKSME